MNQNQILTELNKIFIEIFEDETIAITGKTTQNDIKNWDSLNHIRLISAVEKHFNIKFGLEDLLGFESVEDICKGVEEKLTK